jgi:hypothetical protein
MPTCVLEAYVSRLAEVEAQRRYDAAVASSVPHWTPESANSYLNDLWKVVDTARARVGRGFATGRDAADDLLGWFRGLGFGSGSGVEGE